ncbi:MAG: succinylglutamate desuccinylase/aspartoacylase family protein [Aureispira sp.]
MRMLDVDIAKGEHKIVNLDIARLHTGTTLNVPVIIERGLEDGPCVLLTAGIHGDEMNGVEIVRQIVAKGYNRPQKGTVICIPVVNVFGFLNKTREFPDGRDLNRVFPGSKKGSLASRFAYHLIAYIAPHIDYCIDYHTGGDARFNYSQIRLDASDQDTLELAKVFGAKFIVDAANRDKSFRKTLSKMGKQVLLYEGGQSLTLDRTVTKVGILGALRVMQHLGMRDFSQEIEKYAAHSTTPLVFINKSAWIRAKHSGMFRTEVKLGSWVEQGTKLGSISNPYGNFEADVKASSSGYVICTNHASIVNQGDALLHISKECTGNF